MLGFGSGLIAVGGLALVLPDIRDVVVLQLLVNLPAEIWVVSTSWRNIRWRGIATIFVCIACSIPVGAFFLQSGETKILLAALGAILVLAGITFLLGGQRSVVLSPWVGPPVGVLSGLLTGLFGTGGPPLILYYQVQDTPKAVFRGSLMALFLAMTVIRVPSYAAVGLINLERLLSGLAVLPAVVMGAWLGQRIHLRLAEATFKRVVSLALIAIGVLLIVNTSS